MIDIACPQCGVVYHTLEANVGKHILCTKCGNEITVVLAVTPRSPSAPTVSKPVTTSGRKRRRTYTVGIVAPAAAVLIAFLSLRYANTPKEQISTNKTDEAQLAS